MQKGIFWVIVAILTSVILILIAIIELSEPDWCNDGLNAGQCELYEEDKACYCIDEDSSYVEDGQLTDVYEHSEARCQSLNGSLTVANHPDLVIWLSRRLYFKGIDNAFIALRKHGSKWFWIEKDGSQIPASDVPWRPGVPRDPLHMYGTLNVQTILIGTEEIIDEHYGEHEYKSYNYDYYIDYDTSYQWFGFATSDNTADYTRGAHFICTYIYDPLRMLTPPDSSSTSLPDLALYEQCICDLNEQISLDTLDASHTFSSPRYPNNYCSDANCKWTIKTKDNLVIKVDWVVMSLDFVYVYDGENTQSPLVDQCTATHCSEHVSSGSSMVVNFRSDHVITDIGFKARVTAVGNDECYCSESMVVQLINEDETFNLNSPRFPIPYCINHQCTWTIIGPDKLGIQLTWFQFSLEQHSDHVHVYDGSTIREKYISCTGDKCSDMISAGQQLEIHFTSDNHHSGHIGFSAVVAALPNCELTLTLSLDETQFSDCDKDQLSVPSIGSVSFSKIRDDGYIPVYESAVFTCPPEHKIIDTLDATTDVAVCIASQQWSKNQFYHCIQVCQLSLAPANLGDRMYACDLGSERLVPSGNLMVQEVRDLQSNQLLSIRNFTCHGNRWHPEPLLCHNTMEGIITIAGTTTNGKQVETILRHINVYLPARRQKLRLNLQLLEALSWTSSAVLPDGQIITTGELNQIELINFKKDSVTLQEEMQPLEYYAAGASLGDRLFICGGQKQQFSLLLNSCEMWQDNKWSIHGNMLTRRAMHAMVSIQSRNTIYVLGGYGGCTYAQDLNCQVLSSVEAYSAQNNSWRYVASMSHARGMLSADELDGIIYACGGFSFYDALLPRVEDAVATCESYNCNENIWKPIASMNLARRGFAIVSYGGRLFALGGRNNESEVMDSVQSYSVEDDKWNTMEFYLEWPLAEFGAVVVPFEVDSHGCVLVELEILC